MSRKGKVDEEIKIQAVEGYLSGKLSPGQARALAGSVSKQVFRRWLSVYRNYGAAGLRYQKNNQRYSAELKYQAVRSYLADEGGKQAICEKYGIRNPNQLRRWLKKYNAHEPLKSGYSRRVIDMSHSRETSIDERISIVEECLARGKDYASMAEKYGCSYQQVRNWVIRYEKMGASGLEDRRGKRSETMTGRTPEEELRIKIAQLEREKYLLQMENDLLKKSANWRRKIAVSSSQSFILSSDQRTIRGKRLSSPRIVPYSPSCKIRLLSLVKESRESKRKNQQRDFG